MRLNLTTTLLCVGLLCLVALSACAQGTAAGTTKPDGTATAKTSDKPTPPLGVTVELLEEPEPDPAAGAQADPAAKPEDEAAAAEATKPEKGPMPKLQLNYDGITFEEVLADLSARLKVIVLCADEKLYTRKYYRHLDIPADEAIPYVCGTMMQAARPAWILCTAEEKLEGDYNPTVRDKARLKVKLEDVALGDALDYIARLAKVGLSATPDTWDLKVNFEAADITLDKLVEALAKEARCEFVTGFVLQPISLKDVREGITRLKEMDTADLNKLVRDGMQGFDEARSSGDMGLGNPASGMKDGMDTFNAMDPAERAEIIGQVAGIITDIAGLVHTLPADTQAMIRTRAQPFLGLAVGGFLGMSGKQRAEFGPIMNALKTFGW